MGGSGRAIGSPPQSVERRSWKRFPSLRRESRLVRTRTQTSPLSSNSSKRMCVISNRKLWPMSAMGAKLTPSQPRDPTQMTHRHSCVCVPSTACERTNTIKPLSCQLSSSEKTTFSKKLYKTNHVSLNEQNILPDLEKINTKTKYIV